jgi:hypothetical protein
MALTETKANNGVAGIRTAPGEAREGLYGRQCLR